MTTIILSGKALHDLATGAAVFAGDRDAPPALRCVELQADSKTLTVRVTDRYRALVGTTVAGEDSSGEPITVLVDAKWLVGAAKLYKADTRVTLELTDTLVSVSTLSGGQSRETLTDAQFPGIDKLFAQWTEAVATETVAFNPEFLADIAKIPAKLHAGRSAGVAPIRLQLRGENKPATFTIEADTVKWRGMVMPVRVN